MIRKEHDKAAFLKINKSAFSLICLTILQALIRKMLRFKCAAKHTQKKNNCRIANSNFSIQQSRAGVLTGTVSTKGLALKLCLARVPLQGMYVVTSMFITHLLARRFGDHTLRGCFFKRAIVFLIK